MSMNLITSAEHAYAAAAREAVAIWKFVRSSVVPMLQKAEASAATIEEITGLVDPQAENIERGAFAVLGMLLHLIDQAEDPDAPLDIQLTPQVVAEIRAIGSAVKVHMNGPALKSPAGTITAEAPQKAPAGAV